MRAFGCGDREGELQLIDDLLQDVNRHGANYRSAFVADELGLVPANDPGQAAAAVRIPEFGMRECGCYDPLIHGFSVGS